MEVNKIICGKCEEVLKDFPDNCIDTIITDPPYGLKFMGKKWDYNVPSIEIWQECLRVLKPGGTALIFAGSRTQHRMAVNVEDAGFILKDCIMWIYGSGFPKATDISKQLDKIAGKERKIISEYQYPDGRKRTNHPQNKGTSFDSGGKAGIPTTAPATPEAILWNGWKSHGLKPAYEPILVAMKPNEGSYANNALKWGVAGLNIDGGRIGFEKGGTVANNPLLRKQKGNPHKGNDWYPHKGQRDDIDRNQFTNTKGRYPANVILECICDDVKEGEIKTAGWKDTDKGTDINGTSFSTSKIERTGKHYGKNGKEKTIIHTNPECPCYMLDEQSGTLKSGKNKSKFPDMKNQWLGKSYYPEELNYGDMGGASRFFYCAKASKSERNRGCEELSLSDKHSTYGDYEGTPEHSPNIESKSKNNHPTVKPLSLMKYLCTITKTPTGGIVLDPFCGSGTTLMACKETGRDYIGIEKDKEYCEIARRRIKAIPELLF